MEFLIAILIGSFIISVISDAVKRHKQKILDKIAHQVLDADFNYQMFKKEILSVRENLSLIKSHYFVLNFLGNNKIPTKLNFKVSNSVCPRCSGKLVRRKSKFGYFWGCNNYPKCLYIRKNK